MTATPETTDATRRAQGLPPIFVTRPLTDEERADHRDLVLRDAAGRVLSHWVPMCQQGWLVWVNVMAAGQ